LLTKSDLACYTGDLSIRLALALAAVVLGLVVLDGQAPAKPLDPITAIIDAFRDHDIVALGEGKHNNEQAMDFRLALVRDPRFPTSVNDIVVESGSSTHQDVMDRFIRGEQVSDATLRRAWQDTTQPDPVWDVPMYEAFFRAVRDVNSRLQRERQLRVLLGDPPFNWDTATRDEWLKVDRDSFPADLIDREVLKRQRRALVIYGDMHLARRGMNNGPNNLVTRLESSAKPPRVFSVWTHADGRDLVDVQPDVATWPIPALALTRATTLGAAPFSIFYRSAAGSEIRMEERFDAVLYLGPVARIVVRRGEIAPSLCGDAAYLKMRYARLAMIDPPDRPGPPGILTPAAALRNYCASVQ
jgi:hypothetical protein